MLPAPQRKAFGFLKGDQATDKQIADEEIFQSALVLHRHPFLDDELWGR
jgi:hypothetical protein